MTQDEANLIAATLQKELSESLARQVKAGYFTGELATGIFNTTWREVTNTLTTIVNYGGKPDSNNSEEFDDEGIEAIIDSES